MVITAEFSAKVGIRRIVLEALLNAALRHEANANLFKSQASGLWAEMNVRERYLWGWFGGDRIKVAEHRLMSTLADYESKNAGQLQVSAALIHDEMNTLVRDYLRDNDAHYQELVEPLNAAIRVSEATNQFLCTISLAAEALDGAEYTELVEAYTPGSGSASLSHLENSEAAAALQRLHDAAESYRAVISQYGDVLRGQEASQNPNGTDEAASLAADVISHVESLCTITLNELDKAEEKIAAVQSKVVHVGNVIAVRMVKAKLSVDAYVGEVKMACAGSAL